MYDLDKIPHHQAIKDIGDLLATQTGNKNPVYFRMVTAYFLAKIASSMRAYIKTDIMGEIPINVFVIAFGTSGFGKGASVKIIEKQLIDGFRKRFLNETYPTVSNNSLYSLAVETAILRKTSEDTELKILEKEFNRLGPKNFTFDSGTTAAIKQARDKDLLANIGSLNLQVDEFGSNLTKELDIIHTFLELYDGELKQKLVKNTNENPRTKDLTGTTPANVLLFGTPDAVFDSDFTEKTFLKLLEIGYARRSLFAYGIKERVQNTLSAQQIYQKQANPINRTMINNWKDHFTNLADPHKHELEIELLEPEAIELINYQIYCERRADQLSDFDKIQKAELVNRHFKCLKLAGVFAFIDEDQFIRKEHILSAIKLVEESGECFDKMLDREPNFATLAKYIASTNTPVSHAHLHEKLPFYKESSTKRKELITLATAWGYDNNIIIKSTFEEGIEFFTGSTLEQTDLNQLLITTSEHQAYQYTQNLVTFDELASLGQLSDLHWCNHDFEDGHRCELKVKTGFNIIVLDVDDGQAPIHLVHELLKGFNHIIYSTKRHTKEENRFRIIIPIKYILHLDKEDYTTFMNNIIDWLPFNSDYGANQRARKWLSHEAEELLVHTNDILFDPIQFIPKTSKNNLFKKELSELGSLESLERWFAMQMSTHGHRNNHFIKYALMLNDFGYNFIEIKDKILNFNSKLPNPLPDGELESTVLKSIASKMKNQKQLT